MDDEPDQQRQQPAQTRTRRRGMAQFPAREEGSALSAIAG